MDTNSRVDKKIDSKIYDAIGYYEEPDEKFPLDVIFNNLDNISKINVGDKLTHDDKYITIDTSYVKSVTRLYYRISRYTNLDFINKILSESYKYLNILRNNKDDASGIMWVKLISKLKLSLNGLAKLRQTYSGDEEFTKQIDICIKKLCKHT